MIYVNGHMMYSSPFLRVTFFVGPEAERANVLFIQTKPSKKE